MTLNFYTEPRVQNMNCRVEFGTVAVTFVTRNKYNFSFIIIYFFYFHWFTQPSAITVCESTVTVFHINFHAHKFSLLNNKKRSTKDDQQHHMHLCQWMPSTVTT